MVEQPYQSKRRQQLSVNQPIKPKTPQVWPWLIVCLLIFSVLVGLWSMNQTLLGQNQALRQQLAQKSEETTTCKPEQIWKANLTETQNISVEGENRTFIVHTPADFHENKYYPLLIFYSGKGANTAAVEKTYGLNQLPGIVAYPVPSPGIDGPVAWQGAPYSSSANDIAFTKEMIKTMQSELCIDRSRIYAAGLSNGGGFAALLSCKMNDTFAAFALVSAALYAPERDCIPAQPRAILSIHGDKDPAVPYDGSVLKNLPAIDPWMAKRAADNGCSQPITVHPQAAHLKTIWGSCKENATVENIRIIGGGHTWGVVSNDEIWDFLSHHSLY